MEIIAFDGYTFSAGDYWVGVPDVANIGNFNVLPQTLQRRAQASTLAGITIAPRSITVEIGYNGSALTFEDAFQKLIGLLDPTNEQERTLTATLNNGTTVSCQAIVLPPGSTSFGDDDVQVQPVTFFTVDPYWHELTPTTASATFSSNGAVALVNNGRARAHPTFEISYSTQRASDTATVGWKYRRQVTIENDSDEDWTDQPVCVDLGDTGAWVTASKALITGNDIRIRYQGQELNRTLVNVATARTLCWFLVSIKAGSSNTYDVWYGNTSATEPDNLSTRTDDGQTYVAFDLEGDAGTATNASTTTAITVSGAAWETDRWKDGFVGIVTGTGSVRYRRIASNNGDTLTLNRALNTAADNTSTVVIWKSGIFMDGGRVTAVTSSSATDDQHTTKWGVNQLAGATVTFHASTANPATMTVETNTANAMTFTSSFVANPTVGDSYTIQRYGVYNYVVDTTITETAHRGVYRANRYYEPPGNLWPGELTPGGWGPDTYLPNSDDYSVFGPYNTGSGGGHAANYWVLPRIRRRVRQPALYKFEKVGDGMSTYSPFRYQGAYADYQWKNQNGICQAVWAYKEPAGEDWQDVVTSSTTQASLTPVAAQYVNLDAVNNPTRFGFFVLPVNGVEIPSETATASEAEFRTNDTLILYLDLTSFGSLSSSIYSVGAESECYDANMDLRLGGGEEAVKEPPYERVKVGGSGHHLGLLSTEKLVIRTDPATNEPAVAVYNTSDVLQYRAPWAVRFYTHRANIMGVDTGVVSDDFMPVPPYDNLISNYTFLTDLTGWGDQEDEVGVTATWSRDAGVYKDAAGSLKCVIGASPVGDWYTWYKTTTAFATVVGEVYDVGVWARTTNTSLKVSAYIEQVNLATYGTIFDVPGNVALPATGAFYSVGASFEATDTSTKLYLGVEGNGSLTGTVYFDVVVVGRRTNLYVSETAMGTIAVETSLTEAYHG